VTRVIAWFSNGAASACAAKLAIQAFGDAVEVVYCDTSRDEHPDNLRFRAQVEAWLGRKVTVIAGKYASIEDVARKERYMAGPAGAKCTVEMKKVPRFAFQRADDIHVFGLTYDEPARIKNFRANNPELLCDWILQDLMWTKKHCMEYLQSEGIELPAMYRLGYRNNNCIGCFKATSPGYWNMIRRDFPEVFARRAEQSRALGVKLVEVHKVRTFLDELDPSEKGRYESISCGPECAPSQPQPKGGAA
jgi:3'-phosphoadenosine 5'-phosphosulfate sulfotransferase (PAPS reductase)/FAD synthetase